MNPRAALLALVTLAVAASACTQTIQRVDDSLVADAGIDDVVAAASPPCTIATVGSCALPYPSNEFTVPDPSSATGKRVEVPEGLIDAAVLDRLGPGASLDDAFGGADGFSAIGPVVFQLNHPIHPDSVPPDGGDVVAVHDAQSGERQSIRAQVWPDSLRRGAFGTVVIAWPETRWDYGRTYVAKMGRVPGLLAVSPSPPPALVRGDGHLAGVLEQLARIDGSEPSALLSATEFTVRSRQNSIGGLEKMALVAAADEHPVRNLVSRPPAFFESGSAIVTGEVRITDFRDANGVVDPDSDPSHSWIPFVLALPAEPSGGSGAPLAIYGHGLLINKESMLIVASHNARKGVATIGIDVPNHGGRQAGQGGYLLDIAKPRHLGRIAGMVPQGIVDHVSLVKAIHTQLASIDLAPWNPSGSHGDGAADIDPSLLLYQGTSMGSVLGAAEFALNPEIDAAFLQVPGIGIVDIITNSILWPLFSPTIPQNASAGDAAALIGAASMLFDLGDATHLMDGLAATQRPVMAQVGIGDDIVPGFASDRLRTMLGLRDLEVDTIQTDGITRKVAVVPPDARGVIDVWPNDTSTELFGLMGHITFDEPVALRLLSDWLDNRLRAAGFEPTG